MNLKIEIKKILKGDKPTKAYANIVFDNGFVIHGVGVCQNEKGRYVTFPMTSWQKDGEEITRPVCHPISSSARKEIEEAVFKAYEQAKTTN
jgi:stage V sporulation protein G